MVYRKYLRGVFFPIFFFTFAVLTQAQIRPGIKFGVSTPDVDPKDIVISDENGVEYYQVFVENARYGVHAGAFIQMQIGNFFIQPEILYNSTSVDYKIDSLLVPGSGNHFRPFRDTYRNIDFPVLLGLKLGPLRIGGGPVGHIFLQSPGGFDNYDGFEPLFNDLSWGWQAGVGLDFWKLHIDARYEGNLSKLGDHITFFGKKFNFATNNNRFIASLGFSF